jgi:hypothetical protein
MGLTTLPSPSPVEGFTPANSVDLLTTTYYSVTTSELEFSAAVNAILGTLSVLAFMAARGWLRGVGGVYQRRLELRDLIWRPYAMKLGGLKQAW